MSRNTYDLRQSSNAETQISRINTRRRPTRFTDESPEPFHQGSNPTQFTDESSETVHQGSNPTQFTDESFETLHFTSFIKVVIQHSSPFFDIREDVNTSVATADYGYIMERQRVLA